MKNKLVIVTDLGCFRAYRVDRSAGARSPRLKLIEEFTPENAHARLSEIVTDGAGRFPKGAGPQNVSGDMSSGERNDLVLEERRRLIKQVAARLEAQLAADDVESCRFAAASEINRQILDEVSPRARGKIAANVAGNLVKTDKSELLQRF